MAAASYILIVDDDPQITSLLRIVLRRGGWRVRETRSGEQALDMARETPPDAMLLDLRLPGMSGRDVLERMGAEPSLSEVPVIVTTGDLDAPMLPGACATLIKPFRVPALYAAIRAALQAR